MPRGRRDAEARKDDIEHQVDLAGRVGQEHGRRTEAPFGTVPAHLHR